jgi:hypothetical protein
MLSLSGSLSFLYIFSRTAKKRKEVQQSRALDEPAPDDDAQSTIKMKDQGRIGQILMDNY